jgi:hypothetical protein
MPYVDAWPHPLDTAMETRSRLAELFKAAADYSRYHAELEAMVAADRAAGADRTDRSRYLAAVAGLALAELSFDDFRRLKLVQPFESSLAQKQARMDDALQRFESLVDYEVRDVTAAATYYIAEIYMAFSDALIASERPEGLSDAERSDYEMVIEEEAYPFEERAIEVHESNAGFLSAGIYNDWVQKSLDRLALLMPGRYAKSEISEGFLGSIDTYAYRMPIAPPAGLLDPPAEIAGDDGRPEPGTDGASAGSPFEQSPSVPSQEYCSRPVRRPPPRNRRRRS